MGLLIRSWRVLPEKVKAGVWVILLGNVADAGAHLAHHASAGHITVFQRGAHVVILLGMLLTLGGVVMAGHRPSNQNPSIDNSKEVGHVSGRR